MKRKRSINYKETYQDHWKNQGTYGEVRVNRFLERKKKRKEKQALKIERLKRPGCPICGEDPYCYCGDGTPYSY